MVTVSTTTTERPSGPVYRTKTRRAPTPSGSGSVLARASGSSAVQVCPSKLNCIRTATSGTPWIPSVSATSRPTTLAWPGRTNSRARASAASSPSGSARFHTARSWITAFDERAPLGSEPTTSAPPLGIAKSAIVARPTARPSS